MQIERCVSVCDAAMFLDAIITIVNPYGYEYLVRKLWVGTVFALGSMNTDVD